MRLRVICSEREAQGKSPPGTTDLQGKDGKGLLLKRALFAGYGFTAVLQGGGGDMFCDGMAFLE